MKRVAIYARFSSERQNERSCRDQIDLCLAWAEREGMLVVAEYADEAISGASTVNRLGLGRLMRDAREKAFDVVLTEALDRLSRDQADLATIRKQLNFLEIGISTVADGEVGAIHVGLKGLMGELFLADLAQKTRRGLRARVKAGASGGGRSYGYEPVAGKPGELQVIPAEAEVVRRIFAAYVSGETPRAIAIRLNRDQIPAPRGGRWNASTINGSRERQNGIIANRLYRGELVWNRQRFIKDPATGKRVSRLNPESEWIMTEVPTLRIVAPEVFDQAQTIKLSKGSRHAVHARKPPHLLSGLVFCGVCGGSYVVGDRDRLGCAAVKEHSCSNRQRISRAELERRVLSALQERLAAPEAIAAYVQEYHAERRRLASQARSARAAKERRLAELSRTIERGIDAMLAGAAPDGLGARLKAMEGKVAALKAEIDEIDAQGDPVQLHPAAARKFAAMVESLQSHLAGLRRDEPADAVIAEVRKLIARIEVAPAAGYDPRSRKRQSPATITVYGAFADLLRASARKPISQGKVGCGDTLQPLPCIPFAA